MTDRKCVATHLVWLFIIFGHRNARKPSTNLTLFVILIPIMQGSRVQNLTFFSFDSFSLSAASDAFFLDFDKPEAASAKFDFEYFGGLDAEGRFDGRGMVLIHGTKQERVRANASSDSSSPKSDKSA